MDICITIEDRAASPKSKKEPTLFFSSLGFEPYKISMHHLCLIESMRLMSCFLVLLLILFLFEISFAATDEQSKFQNFRSGSVSNLSPFQDKRGPAQNKGEDGSGEAVLGDEKRKIYTGPNPLHNR
ncbi:hypothetical protein RJT34_11100 [Clitoria ternatea]|uniref:Uncharacterized protein n=1 Tax=Clitoria ternatea TaxID=43366 RepID=A0AAN9PJR1_CLITE